MRRKESRINQLVDIGGKPDVTIHKVGNHQVLTSPLNRMAISIWLEYITEVELIW